MIKSAQKWQSNSKYVGVNKFFNEIFLTCLFFRKKNPQKGVWLLTLMTFYENHFLNSLDFSKLPASVNRPFDGRMKSMVITRRQVDHSLVQGCATVLIH